MEPHLGIHVTLDDSSDAYQTCSPTSGNNRISAYRADSQGFPSGSVVQVQIGPPYARGASLKGSARVVSALLNQITSTNGRRDERASRANLVVVNGSSGGPLSPPSPHFPIYPAAFRHYKISVRFSTGWQRTGFLMRRDLALLCILYRLLYKEGSEELLTSFLPLVSVIVPNTINPISIAGVLQSYPSWTIFYQARSTGVERSCAWKLTVTMTLFCRPPQRTDAAETQSGHRYIT
ncbi:hypothetical protein EVAR_5805_1 [Eumeta japonica]|uniref:Uncharacterized protein n=1 Tax=Eumeta variegata TaxID=151549 RepID=A0A4C1T7W6_EUMVA|nr:hypothetical protein EVAR_5805_1 [Eumeta japonica]